MALQDNVRAMARVPILEDLGPDALRLIAFSAETRILRAGDVVFRAGERSDCGFVVLSGAIAVGDGATATLAKAPALIGETAIIAETIRPADAVARAPSSVMKITRSLFHRVMLEYPDSAARVRQKLAGRLRLMQDDLDRLAASSFST